jgi:ArsR family transcriptional regulator
MDGAARRIRELESEVLRALGHPVRLAILELLRDGERCVCEIEPELGLRQPNISQHLAALRAARLVATRREGARVMYRVVDPGIFQVLDLLPGIVRRQGTVTADIPSRDAVARAG